MPGNSIEIDFEIGISRMDQMIATRKQFEIGKPQHLNIGTLQLLANKTHTNKKQSIVLLEWEFKMQCHSWYYVQMTYSVWIVVNMNVTFMLPMLGIYAKTKQCPMPSHNSDVDVQIYQLNRLSRHESIIDWNDNEKLIKMSNPN